jgi:hypothetical protein
MGPFQEQWKNGEIRDCLEMIDPDMERNVRNGFRDVLYETVISIESYTSPYFYIPSPSAGVGSWVSTPLT